MGLHQATSGCSWSTRRVIHQVRWNARLASKTPAMVSSMHWLPETGLHATASSLPMNCCTYSVRVTNTTFTTASQLHPTDWQTPHNHPCTPKAGLKSWAGVLQLPPTHGPSLPASNRASSEPKLPLKSAGPGLEPKIAYLKFQQ